ncbi:thioredoxin family protein [Odoribacter sp. AF15-53]|uniref:thioredoxin family protein n=1 Tax=Odoribacter sp. AF15-53 TaxID=2292236 RepID=UPI001F22CF7A|nr:thioredoxin family protein [Odoribacter sp. AF15-53]
MKKLVFVFVCMFVIESVFAQTHFQDLTFEKAIEKAKAENKYVFIDCYTVWCGPCKMMAEKILPLEDVGKYMNERFVCIKLDMEKGEGREIARKYHVTAYPTFLILKTDQSLVHRVVGGTASGEEFIKKIEAGFDENAASNLEIQYVAGNRDLNFLVKYIKALLVSCDVEKAKGIAQEVLASLDDEEKCTDPYWFIYEDTELSPIGSGNMNYLLKRVEKFREGVGVEKVDKKLASLFESQLEDIIRGRNKNATLADVEAAEKLLDSYKLTGQDYLFEYIALIKAVKSENTEETLKLCNDIYPKMADEKVAYLYFTPIVELQYKWDKKQKKELTVLTRKMADKVELTSLKHSLKSFADVTIPRLGEQRRF